MKGNIDLQGLAAEVSRIAEAKRDFVADTRSLRMLPAEQGEPSRIAIEGQGEFEVRSMAHDQVAARLGIPARYYRRMQEEAPTLLAANVNTWLQRSPERRMVRTLDGAARAFVSDKFRAIDHDVMLAAVLPAVAEIGRNGGIEVKALTLTERRLYMQIVSPSVSGEVRVGQVVQAGVTVTNSEVGLGAWDISSLVWTLVCSNGMVGESLIRRHHVGARLGREVDGALEIEDHWGDDTVAAEIEAIQLRTRDTIRHALSEAFFRPQIERMQRAAFDSERIADVPAAVEEVTRRLSLTEAEGNNVLGHLVEGGDLSQWGMASAVTRAAQDAESHDRAWEMERAGSRLIDLPKTEWKAVAVPKAA